MNTQFCSNCNTTLPVYYSKICGTCSKPWYLESSSIDEIHLCTECFRKIYKYHEEECHSSVDIA